MFGKWHMGLDVDPKPGFDHWACFRGQGTYFNPELNVNGTLQTLEGFTDDVTTRQACDWIASAPDRPSLTILGYKSCHSPFDPAPRTSNLYSDVRIAKPATFDKPAPDQPAWIQKFDDTGHTPYSRIPYDELVLRFARLVSGSTTTSAFCSIGSNRSASSTIRSSSSPATTASFSTSTVCTTNGRCTKKASASRCWSATRD